MCSDADVAEAKPAWPGVGCVRGAAGSKRSIEATAVRRRSLDRRRNVDEARPQHAACVFGRAGAIDPVSAALWKSALRAGLWRWRVWRQAQGRGGATGVWRVECPV